MPINKFTTLLDLARQAKIITGETATFDGKIQAGIPFSGYPTGVDTGTTVSLGVVSSEDAVFSGDSGTTIFDVANTGSTNYSPIFSGYSGSVWTNVLFSGNTSGLTLPITPLSADTQVVGPFWTLTQTGMTGDYVIGTQYTGYSVTYSFFNVSQLGTGFTYSGFTTASQENFSAGTLDYKGPLDYISTKEDASVEGRLTTNKLTVTNGASASTIGYVLTQTGENGEAEWVINASADTNTYVTGGTLNGTQLDLTYNTGGSVPSIELSGLTFTGNTSGDCINDIFVKNIHSCSPLFINPNDEGNVYFGSSSGITIDLTNERLGIGTSSPQYSLQILDTNSTFYYDPTSAGGRFSLSGNTRIPRYDILIAPYLTNPATGGSFGMRTWDDTLSPGYGKVGDMFIYAGNDTNGLNIINSPGTGIEDYIRFYAGQQANGTTPDLHIQGSGSTRGYVGIGTETPTEKLVVDGNVKIIGNTGSLIRSLTIGDDDEITFSTQGTSVADNVRILSQPTSGRIFLKNGTINDRYSEFGQFSIYGALIMNVGSSSGEMYIQNSAEESALVFRVGSAATLSDVCYMFGDKTIGKDGPFSGVSNSKIVYALEYLSVGINASFGAVGSTAFAQDIRIDANGVLTTNTSDERLKENINSLSGSLETILQLSGVSYNWKDRNSGGDDTRYGFIAQRVDEVDSNLTTTNKVDGFMGLKSDCFTPLIVESIKELYNNPSIPNYTPSSSGDTYGSVGNVTIDDNYLYVKTNNGWKRTTLESF